MSKEDKKELYKKAFSLLEEGHHLTDVANELGIKYVTLRKQVESNGINYVKPKTRIPFKFHSEIKNRYLSGESCSAIAKSLSCSSHAIQHFLKISDIEIRPHTEDKFYNKNYSINRDAFLDLESEGAAYFFGWILSDGYLCPKGKYITLSIHRDDEDILHMLRGYLNSSNKIHQRDYLNKSDGKIYYSSQFTFSGKEIVERLKKLGLENKKSLSEVCPSIFLHNKHFWRGYLDGDGSVYSGKSSPRVEIHGGEIICSQFQEYCSALGLKSSIYTQGNNGNLIHRCVVSGKKNSKKILDNLYGECSYKLTRKYQIYLDRIVNGLY